MGHILIKYFISNKIWLTRSDMNAISKMILNEFKTEDKDFYFKEPEGTSKAPKGILFSRYCNQLHKYRIGNLIIRRNRNLKDAAAQTTGKHF